MVIIGTSLIRIPFAHVSIDRCLTLAVSRRAMSGLPQGTSHPWRGRLQCVVRWGGTRRALGTSPRSQGARRSPYATDVRRGFRAPCATSPHLR